MTEVEHAPVTPAFRLGALGVVIAAAWGSYYVIGAREVGDHLHTLDTAFDRAVPMQPAWVLVYAAIYFQASAPAAVVTDRRTFLRTVGGYLSLYAIAIPIWLVWPVTVPRTDLPIVDLWTYGIGITRLVDPPTNCFPSMHVGLAMYAALVVRRHDRAAGNVLLACGTLIAWSTLATHQHWLADVVAATLLALLADRVWLGGVPEALRRPLPRRWHTTWVAAYVGVIAVLMSGWFFGWLSPTLLPPNVHPWGPGGG